MKRFGQIEIVTAVIIIVTSLAVPVLAEITWSGDVYPSDPSAWDLSTDGFIGNNSNGTMSITGGSDVLDYRGNIGFSSGSTGAVTIDGAGSTWSNDNSFSVGFWGDGTLDITNGGGVSSGSGRIGAASGSTGAVTVDGAGSTWSNDSSFSVGDYGNGTLNINNGGEVSSDTIAIGGRESAMGEVTVDGAGSLFSISDYLGVGFRANGTLNVTGGGTVSCGRGDIGSQSGGTGTATVDGAGSVWTIGGLFAVGTWSNGTLNITNGGLVSVAGRFIIANNGSDDSFINMATGGKLALLGEGGDSLVDFMGLIDGTDAIHYWDSSIADWADITGATYGIDYTLEYLTEGDLTGYTMLTVPEPATMLLLGLGGLMVRKRR